MKSLSAEELRAFLVVARQHSERDWLMCKLMFNHAMRVSEALSLTAKNVVDGYLILNRLKGSRPIEHPVLPDEKEVLLALCEEVPKGPLFPMSRQTAWRHIKAYGVEAGIAAHRVFPHCFKHSMGRLGYLGGMTVQELVEYMGHRNATNSMRYSQATSDEAAAAFAAAVGSSGRF